jgi:hypothetical protein
MCAPLAAAVTLQKTAADSLLALESLGARTYDRGERRRGERKERSQIIGEESAGSQVRPSFSPLPPLSFASLCPAHLSSSSLISSRLGSAARTLRRTAVATVAARGRHQEEEEDEAGGEEAHSEAATQREGGAERHGRPQDG